MSEFQLSTPVAFIIFNRPDTTERVFAEIARARPPKLLVVGDGPRANRPGEAEKVAACRAIINRVDWPCEVLTNYSEANLGCKVRVSSGLDWVFEQVPEAIILEDDCLPHPTFFRFCQELLERYRDDERIGMISGDNFQFGVQRGDSSYYFSRFNHIWGWASWRRAWDHYDVTMREWPQFLRNNSIRNVASSIKEQGYWLKTFQSVYNGKIDTWDYQWTFALWCQGMKSVLPNNNLISNIGFGVDATHTFDIDRNANIPSRAINFPLIHPLFNIVESEADCAYVNKTLTKSFIQRIFSKIQKILKIV